MVIMVNKMWRDACNLLHGLKPALMMVVVQVAYGLVNILYKLAANDGMSLRVIIAYRFVFAAAFMVPVALILERNRRPKLNFKILVQAFLCGLLGGSLCQNVYLESLVFTSATYASGMFNLVPAITFILAISIRIEKLGIKTRAGKAKVLGTIVGIAGAMLLTFYKGIEIKIWSTHFDLLHRDHLHGAHVASLHADSSKRLLGSLLALGSCFSFALWLIIQAKMSEEYPCQYSSTALMCLMGAIQSVVFALCVEKDWSQWKLGWNIRLLTVTFSGIVASGLMVTVTCWCVRMRGPLFASAFNPLILLVVAFLGSLLLDEKLHLGSVVGATLIVLGLYGILWGKGKDMKKITQLDPSKSFRESESIDIVVTSPIDGHMTANQNEDKQESDRGQEKILANEDEEKQRNYTGEVKGTSLRYLISTEVKGSQNDGI